jgi:hypothetical protein
VLSVLNRHEKAQFMKMKTVENKLTEQSVSFCLKYGVLAEPHRRTDNARPPDFMSEGGPASGPTDGPKGLNFHESHHFVGSLHASWQPKKHGWPVQSLPSKAN